MYLDKFNKEALKYIYDNISNRYGKYTYKGPDYASTNFFYETIVNCVKKFELGNEIIEYLSQLDDDEYDMFCDKIEHKMVDENILEYS